MQVILIVPTAEPMLVLYAFTVTLAQDPPADTLEQVLATANLVGLVEVTEQPEAATVPIFEKVKLFV